MLKKIKYTLSFLLAIIACSEYNSEVTSSKQESLSCGNLVAAYNFDQTTGTVLNDISGNGNNGTVTAATWSTTSKAGRALSFNGTTANVSIPSSASLSLDTTMTVEAWVRPTSLGTTWRTVILREASGSDLSWGLYANQNIHESSPVPSFWLKTDVNQASPISGSGVLATNTWQHLAASYDGVIAKFYLNGTQVATRTLTGSLAASTSPLRIGGNSVFPGSEFFAGQIDTTCLWNSVRTAAQIQSDMATTDCGVSAGVCGSSGSGGAGGTSGGAGTSGSAGSAGTSGSAGASSGSGGANAGTSGSGGNGGSAAGAAGALGGSGGSTTTGNPISIVGSSHLTNYFGTTIPIAHPTAAIAGDQLLLFYNIVISNSQNTVITPSAGWTLVQRSVTPDNWSTMAIYRKTDSGSEPASYSFTVSQSQYNRVAIVALRDVDPVNVIADKNGSGNFGMQWSAPSLTATNNGSLMLLGFQSGTDPTNPAGLTRYLDEDELHILTKSVNAGSTGAILSSFGNGGNWIEAEVIVNPANAASSGSAGAGGNASGGSGGAVASAGSAGAIAGSGGASAGSGGASAGSGGASAGSAGLNTGGSSSGAGGLGGSSSGAGGSVVTGTWVNVTPSGIDLTTTDDNNFGAQDIVVDPARPSDVYVTTCMSGVWRSQNYGKAGTWTKVNTGTNGSLIDSGKSWSATLDFNALRDPSTSPSIYTMAGTGIQWGIYKSVDFGVNWSHTTMPALSGQDTYSIDTDPNDSSHLIASMHDSGMILESTDASATWSVVSGVPGTGVSPYIFFINTGNVSTTRSTWLAVSQWGNGGTWRTTNSGATWTKVSSSIEHFHGNSQIYNAGSGIVYIGAAGGVYVSTDSGATWIVEHSGDENGVVATPTKMYATFGWASNTGWNAINPVVKNRTTGVYSTMPIPSGMTNGWKRAAVTNDGSNYIIISSNWNAGLWRYVE